MVEPLDNPAKSNDPEVVKKYFIDVLGFTTKEAELMAKNWTRAPQTETEIREGILWERKQRLENTKIGE